MRPRENTLRVKRFAAEESARKVEDLEGMIREFEQMIADLERQIASEEDRTGVKDVKHFAYSTLAKAAAQRRENLVASIEELRARLGPAVAERDAAMETLQISEVGETRDVGRGRRRAGNPDARLG